MPKEINIHPAQYAWEKFKAEPDAYSKEVREVFISGWNAALAWIPFRVEQFREIEEAYKKEIEDLKRGNPPVDSGPNPA